VLLIIVAIIPSKQDGSTKTTAMSIISGSLMVLLILGTTACHVNMLGAVVTTTVVFLGNKQHITTFW
jgi:hypothetical protein